jgi:DNA-binding NtrC family response regulator
MNAFAYERPPFSKRLNLVPHKVLIVDDEAELRIATSEFLEQRGFKVTEAASCKNAIYEFRRNKPDAVILDYALPDGSALDILRQLQSIDSTVPTIILTGHGSIDLAVTAIKLGAEQFLTKPVELSALAVVLERALENQRNRQHTLASGVFIRRSALNPFVGVSKTIRQLADQAEKVANSESSVLIVGETGSGKGVLARWIHENGARSKQPFVDMNCAGFARELLETELFGHEKGAFTGAINKKIGLFEVAHRGTVFLDEIGDMDLQLQPKLLKVLEEKTFRRVGDTQDRWADTRLLAATHQNLSELVAQDKFRSDLYFRINTVVLRAPPLRERIEDIELLAEELLGRMSQELGRPELKLDSKTVDVLRRYRWPGNIRELRNVIERAVLLADENTLQPKHMQFEPAVSTLNSNTVYSTKWTLEQLEHEHIRRVLDEEKGHVARAAIRLDIPLSTLYYKLKSCKDGPA